MRGPILAMLALLTTTAGALALTPAEIERRLVAAAGVEVLAIRETTVDGRRVYVVTVMFPGGDRNGAFQVGELWLDAETGEPVPRLRHRAEGYELPPPRLGEPREPAPDDLRTWTFGGPPPR